MKVIELERLKGKTTELINLADHRKGYIVCHSRDEAHRIFSEAKRLNKNISLPITYSEFEEYRGFPHMEFFFDNFDMYIQSKISGIFAGKNIGAITLTENFSISDLIRGQRP